ncbi:MAG: AEC family transporter [Pseudomonadota bacterium]
MNQPVFASLLPVVFLIGAGVLARRRGWISAQGVKELSNLAFLLLAPALLFRTMATVRLEQMELRPIATYFIGAGIIFLVTLLLRGLNRRAVVLALAGTYSNAVMIGIPLVGLAYGDAGLVPLFTLVSMHAVVMLTLATVLLELSVAREERAAGLHAQRSMAHTVALAVRNAIVHPVPLPIIAGLLFAQTGWTIPPLVDKPMQLLGSSFGPLALVLVGATLASSRIGALWRGALALALAKNLGHPVLVVVAAWALGTGGLPVAVMALTAALPIGANVFLFSQRYGVDEELITAAVAVSTVLAMATTWLVLWVTGSMNVLPPM